MTTRTDYVIVDRTNAYWPGSLPYRTADSARGYRTYAEAARRLERVVSHYNATHGRSPGDLRIVERTNG